MNRSIVYYVEQKAIKSTAEEEQNQSQREMVSSNRTHAHKMHIQMNWH